MYPVVNFYASWPTVMAQESTLRRRPASVVWPRPVPAALPPELLRELEKDAVVASLFVQA